MLSSRFSVKTHLTINTEYQNSTTKHFLINLFLFVRLKSSVNVLKKNKFVVFWKAYRHQNDDSKPETGTE